MYDKLTGLSIFSLFYFLKMCIFIWHKETIFLFTVLIKIALFFKNFKSKFKLVNNLTFNYSFDFVFNAVLKSYKLNHIMYSILI